MEKTKRPRSDNLDPLLAKISAAGLDLDYGKKENIEPMLNIVLCYILQKEFPYTKKFHETDLSNKIAFDWNELENILHLRILGVIIAYYLPDIFKDDVRLRFDAKKIPSPCIIIRMECGDDGLFRSHNTGYTRAALPAFIDCTTRALPLLSDAISGVLARSGAQECLSGLPVDDLTMSMSVCTDAVFRMVILNKFSKVYVKEMVVMVKFNSKCPFITFIGFINHQEKVANFGYFLDEKTVVSRCSEQSMKLIDEIMVDSIFKYADLRARLWILCYKQYVFLGMDEEILNWDVGNKVVV